MLNYIAQPARYEALHAKYSHKAVYKVCSDYFFCFPAETYECFVLGQHKIEDVDQKPMG